ncbi:hypothetical protein L1887_58449 [Cichorium endivia]|nr:hypothetical protein L1887_58449 [Cichorium endivia]
MMMTTSEGSSRTDVCLQTRYTRPLTFKIWVLCQRNRAGIADKSFGHSFRTALSHILLDGLLGDLEDLAGPDLKVVAEVEEERLCKHGLGDLCLHALVPAADALLLGDLGEAVDGARVARVLGLQTDLAEDVGEGDDGGERLGERTHEERLARRHLAVYRGGEDDGLDALEDAVGDRRVDGEHERRLEAAPEARDTVLLEDVPGDTHEALVDGLAVLGGLGGGELLPRRNHGDGDGEDLRERTGDGTEHELGSRAHDRDAVSTSLSQAVLVERSYGRVPVKVGKAGGEGVDHAGSKALVQAHRTLLAVDDVQDALDHADVLGYGDDGLGRVLGVADLLARRHRRALAGLDARLDRVERVDDCIGEDTTEGAGERLSEGRERCFSHCVYVV